MHIVPYVRYLKNFVFYIKTEVKISLLLINGRIVSLSLARMPNMPLIKNAPIGYFTVFCLTKSIIWKLIKKCITHPFVPPFNLKFKVQKTILKKNWTKALNLLVVFLNFLIIYSYRQLREMDEWGQTIWFFFA